MICLLRLVMIVMVIIPLATRTPNKIHSHNKSLLLVGFGSGFATVKATVFSSAFGETDLTSVKGFAKD